MRSRSLQTLQAQAPMYKMTVECLRSALAPGEVAQQADTATLKMPHMAQPQAMQLPN
jgi:hypothetical protein